MILILIIGFVAAVLVANMAQKTAIGDNSAGVIGKVAYKISILPEMVETAVREATGYTNRYAKPAPEFRDLLNKNIYSEHLPGYVTRSSADGDKYELLRLSDGSVFEAWENLPYAPRAVSLYDNTVLLGGVMGPEDSTRAIKKYDQQGKELWNVSLYVHHTIYVDNNGLIYTPIVMPTHEYLQSLMPPGSEYRDDGYAVLDPDGNILEQKSVTQILLDNDLGHLVLGVGPLEEDAIHLNAVKVAEMESDYWEVGDLLMSARHMSLVFLYRPSTGKIIWHQSGPWLNQHDPDFLNSTEISVFGNDMVSSYSNRTSEEATNYIDGGNDIYVYNFETQETSIRYKDVMDRAGLATVTSGEHHVFDDGSLFVWFSNTGMSMIYNEKSDTIGYFGQAHDEQWLDRKRASLYVAEPVK